MLGCGEHNIDLRPVITYEDGKPVEVETYCLVNLSNIAVSTYSTDGENFYEKHFDEHHGKYDVKPQATTRKRLSSMRSRLPILAILEAPDKKTVEDLVSRIEVKHRDVKKVA